MALKDLTDKELLEYHKLYKRGKDKSSRFEIYKFHQYDAKFAYHILRLFDEVEQILLENDLNLQRSKEVMKAVRRGEWTADEIRNWAMEKEKALEVAYTRCKLPEHPPVAPLRQLLINCLEQHYGSLEDCVVQVDWAEATLKNIDKMLEDVRKKLYS